MQAQIPFKRIRRKGQSLTFSNWNHYKTANYSTCIKLNRIINQKDTYFLVILPWLLLRDELHFETLSNDFETLSNDFETFSDDFETFSEDFGTKTGFGDLK